MALIVQKLENVVNILDDTRAAGEQIINSLSTDCVAQVQYKDPLPDQIDIWDSEGLPTQVLTFDGTLQVQDLGGAPVVFGGTIDDLINKLNNEYFDNAVTSSGGGGGTSNVIIVGDTTKSNFQKLKTEANDLNKAFTFLDAGTSDERPSTIVYSSVALGLTVTKTFTWAGAAGAYYVNTIILS